jgi:hypothetical protein
MVYNTYLAGNRCKIGSGSVGHVYAGKYEQHPVAIKQHKLDGSQLDQKALQEFEIEVCGCKMPCAYRASPFTTGRFSRSASVVDVLCRR